MVVDDDPHIRAAFFQFRKLSRVSLSRDRPIAHLIMADVVASDAAWNEVEFSLMPNPLPAVEKASHFF
jgi:hypothetical protein